MNKTLKLLFICNGIFVLAGGLLGPLYALFVQRVGGDIIAVSFTWGVFNIATVLSLAVLEEYGDRIKNRMLLLAGGFLVRMTVWLLYIIVPSVTGLIFLQALLGIGEALGTPAFGALMAEHLDHGRHVKEYSEWNLVSNIVSALAIMSGGFVVARFGFAALFSLMGFLAFLSFLLVLPKILPERNRAALPRE